MTSHPTRSAEPRFTLSPTGAITLGAAGLLAAPLTHAATFSVTNLNDSGVGSLRQAILDANAAAGTDTVDLSGVTGTITLTSGNLVVTDALTISGPGATALTVSGNNSSNIFAINGIAATISGLGMTQGQASFGGAVAVYAGASLNLSDCIVSASHSSNVGGGLAFYDVGSVSISNCTIDGNSATNQGGGIFLYDPNGTFVITDSVISNNSAGGSSTGGGGAYLYGSEGITITRTTVSGNMASGHGGGICFVDSDNVGDILVDSSTFSGNTSSQFGGGMSFQWLNSGGARVVNSTISGNSANYGGGVVAFYLADPVALEHSTVVNNSATASGGGVDYLGSGGLDAAEGALRKEATISGNVAPQSLSFASDVFGLDHTIVANNSAPSNPDTAGSMEASYAFIENVGSASLTDSGGNIIGQDPQLGALANNGGTTLTHLPATGSPVIDAGDPAISGAPASDQRGEARIYGTAIDIGAVEVGETTPAVPTLNDLGKLLLGALLIATALGAGRRRMEG